MKYFGPKYSGLNSRPVSICSGLYSGILLYTEHQYQEASLS